MNRITAIAPLTARLTATLLAAGSVAGATSTSAADVAGEAAVSTALATAAFSAGTADDIQRPLLVGFGPGARPWNFVGDGTIPHIDSLPFSGFVYNLPATWLTMNSETYGVFTETQIRDQFGGIDHAFENLTENMVGVVIRRRGNGLPEGDFFDDEAWAINVDQMRLLARVASEPQHQCVGIAFDNEEYFEDVWNHPDDVAHADLYGLAQYEAKARERGREMMLAILEEWPSAIVMHLHGPYLSAPEPRPFEVSMNQVGGSQEYELLAPFFMGMAEVAGDGQVIDGGEVYQLRDRRQFGINRHWRENDMAQSVVVPDELRDIWSDRVDFTHGLYNQTWPNPEDLMTPAIMRSTLARALRSGDRMVWLFIEATETWLEEGGFPDAWRDAIEGGAADASRPACPGDANEDGIVGTPDLLSVLAGWNGNGFGPADRDLDGDVDALDLLAVLGSWGACPE